MLIHSDNNAILIFSTPTVHEIANSHVYRN